ncbi:MAG: Fe-S cluster assembly ATPase SufC [Clostridia bacterium]|nr:Fe-S cluster assembly ATPase SufC [Clostridia bacterium]MBR6137001.1 Fe-S cluster assembly ATPase SufC [Bacilli bacterium]
MNKLLEIKNLNTIAEDDNDKQILKGLDLLINEGEIHVIMGPNGSGKSTLANTIFNSPRYIVTEGEIIFGGENITNLSTDKIAKKGIFMSFQTPEEIPGVSLAQFLKTTKHSITGEKPNLYQFTKDVENKMNELGMKYETVNREFNVGFSGGEKKKNEILQMLLLNPKLAILDETDSGLDVDAIKTVSKGINLYKNDKNAVLIITHSTKILKSLKVDKVHILVDGKIVKTGDSSLAKEIEDNGYQEYIK